MLRSFPCKGLFSVSRPSLTSGCRHVPLSPQCGPFRISKSLTSTSSPLHNDIFDEFLLPPERQPRTKPPPINHEDGPLVPPPGTYPRIEPFLPRATSLIDDSVWKRRAPIRRYALHVNAARHNTVLTLAYMEPGIHYGEVVAWASAGSVGFKKSGRKSYEAGYQVAVKMFRKIELEKEGKLHSSPDTDNSTREGGSRESWSGSAMSLEVCFNGFGQGREAVYRALMTAEGAVVRPLIRQITDTTPIKIGGTRSKKKARN